MKTCTNCKIPKPNSQFAWRSKETKKQHSHCKDCQKTKSHKWYVSNKNKHNTNARKNTAKYRKRNRDYIWNYLVKNPCVDCGANDPIILEFDHKNPKYKTCNMYHLVNNCSSLEKLKQEIKKCEIRCANCHRRKTASQLGWWADKLSQ